MKRSGNMMVHPDFDGGRSIGSESYNSSNEDGWCMSIGCGGTPNRREPDLNSSSSAQLTESTTLFLNQTSRRAVRRRKTKNDAIPPNDQTNLSSLIASELSKMTLEDREKVMEEVHGVVPKQREDPDEMSMLLEKVKEELKRIRYKQAYEKAAFLSSAYVTDKEFVTRFLRTENYKPRTTALRLVEHFKYKQELFGEEALVREIMYDDLTEDQKAIFQSGFFFLLPDRDQAGRPVFVCNLREFLNTGTMLDLLRATWYLSMRSAQLSTDTASIVGVYFTHGMGNVWEKLSRDQYVNGTTFLGTALPFKFASVHFCFEDNPIFKMIQTTLMISLGRYARIRLRNHCGSRLECIYYLRSFGINIECDTDATSARAKQWQLERCLELDNRFRELHSQRLLPKSKDVLLGRGRPFQQFSGNLALTVTIAQYRDRYNNAKKMDKKAMTSEIVQNILNSGGRFLKRVNNENGTGVDWEKVDFETARLKVSHSFRTMSKDHKPAGVQDNYLENTFPAHLLNSDEGSFGSAPHVLEENLPIDFVVDVTPSIVSSSSRKRKELQF